MDRPESLRKAKNREWIRAGGVGDRHDLLETCLAPQASEVKSVLEVPLRWLSRALGSGMALGMREQRLRISQNVAIIHYFLLFARCRVGCWWTLLYFCLWQDRGALLG